MTTVLRLSGCLLIAASLVACNREDVAAPAGDVDATATADAAPATAADAPEADREPGELVIETDVTLTMPQVRTYVQAVKNLRAIGVEDITMADGETQEQYEARLAAAEASAAIGQAGMSVDEFVSFGDLFLGAVVAHQLIEANQLPGPPEGMEEAVDFVRQNRAEIDALMASVEDVDG